MCADDGASGARSADAVVCDLLGLYSHHGAAEALGFRWWADTSTPTPSTPWGYLDLDAHSRAVDRYPLRGEWHRPPEDLPIPGPTYMAPPRVDGGPCAYCGTTASVRWWSTDRVAVAVAARTRPATRPGPPPPSPHRPRGHGREPGHRYLTAVH